MDKYEQLLNAIAKASAADKALKLKLKTVQLTLPEYAAYQEAAQEVARLTEEYRKENDARQAALAYRSR